MIEALVLMSADDPDAKWFQNAISSDPLINKQAHLAFSSPELASKYVEAAEVVACGAFPPNFIDRAQSLNWISFWSAGLDGKAHPALIERGIQLTSANGVHVPNIAEHVLMFMLMFTRRMNFYMRNKSWERIPTSFGSSPPGSPNQGLRIPSSGSPGELMGQTLCIVGLGRIGEALTTRAQAMGMRVIGIKRDPSSRYNVEVIPDELHGPDQLPFALSNADHVCLSLPVTPNTYHKFDSKMLGYMKPTAYLYNISRGSVVDEESLIKALQERSIAGAGLDVFEMEPLPASSPLWSMDNVLITPHVAGMTPFYFKRAAALFAKNLRRYMNGEALQNLYQPIRGY